MTTTTDSATVTVQEPTQRRERLNTLTDTALELAVPLDADRPGDADLPDDLRVANGRSAYEAPGGRLYATPDHVRTERALTSSTVQGGAAAMPDYELLELVLFRAIPRQDVKPLARHLLERFGDFNRVLSATQARLS